MIKINFRTTWLTTTPNYKQNILSNCSGFSVFPRLLRPPIEKLMIFSWSGFSSTHLSIHPSNPYYEQTPFFSFSEFPGVFWRFLKNDYHFRISGNIRILKNKFFNSRSICRTRVLNQNLVISCIRISKLRQKASHSVCMWLERFWLDAKPTVL